MSIHPSSAGTGQEYVAPDATVTVKIAAEHTGAEYELFEIDAPRGPAGPPHIESWSKAFYVLHGRILVQAGDHGYDLGPGSSISIPAGTVNTFSVLTPSAKFLTFSRTGRMGAFFADLTTADPTDHAALAAIAGRHGVQLVQS
ncbi:cupin domain-containing protein [Kribbella sandramycini]|uniref:Cupin domain-containing protein n=1 Tax=Kribbella sandramycini TaxID=60450 RepID=A0A7Y4KVJ2_9ACTN|nr:cupin domain-containing protein [Kribbella sandramycini]MBB6567917.1 quercetin dioxygenase-like cupin family protein [Kribbella sandramycini]NOL39488.1 cupin domain-containing protein [Kribbella sandramycini]